MNEPQRLTCHCGAVELRVVLKDGLNTARRCNCSFCSRRGAVMVAADIENVEVVKGAEALTEYRWGTGVARHYFCSTCGIYTHHQRRSNPGECGLNAACLDGVFLPDLEPVEWLNGARLPLD